MWTDGLRQFSNVLPRPHLRLADRRWTQDTNTFCRPSSPTSHFSAALRLAAVAGISGGFLADWDVELGTLGRATLPRGRQLAQHASSRQVPPGHSERAVLEGCNGSAIPKCPGADVG